MYCNLAFKSNSVLPLCVNGLLDRRTFIDASSSENKLVKLMIRPRNEKHCRLNWYTIKDAVNCLTEIKTAKKLHFAFIGDSRIRQQFLNFLKVSKNEFSKTKRKKYLTCFSFKYSVDTGIRPWTQSETRWKDLSRWCQCNQSIIRWFNRFVQMATDYRRENNFRHSQLDLLIWWFRSSAWFYIDWYYYG